MTPTVVLFDIDGTLISTNGAGRRALERCFQELFDAMDVFAEISFAGMTDFAILRRGLEVVGRLELLDEPDTIINHYLKVLADELRRTSGIQSNPGVEELLDRLGTRPDLAIGLGTGNLEAGARLKLEHVDLIHRFEFGGFGSDHEQRDQLLRAGALRGADRLQHPIENCRLVVIGDTPKDIDAGHANQAITVAVATGPYSVHQLEQHDPHLAVTDLSDPRVYDSIVGA